MARAAPSLRAEPTRRARSSRTRRCTTSRKIDNSPGIFSGREEIPARFAYELAFSLIRRQVVADVNFEAIFAYRPAFRRLAQRKRSAVSIPSALSGSWFPKPQFSHVRHLVPLRVHPLGYRP